MKTKHGENLTLLLVSAGLVHCEVILRINMEEEGLCVYLWLPCLLLSDIDGSLNFVVKKIPNLCCYRVLINLS